MSKPYLYRMSDETAADVDIFRGDARLKTTKEALDALVAMGLAASRETLAGSMMASNSIAPSVKPNKVVAALREAVAAETGEADPLHAVHFGPVERKGPLTKPGKGKQ